MVNVAIVVCRCMPRERERERDVGMAEISSEFWVGCCWKKWPGILSIHENPRQGEEDGIETSKPKPLPFECQGEKHQWLGGSLGWNPLTHALRLCPRWEGDKKPQRKASNLNSNPFPKALLIIYSTVPPRTTKKEWFFGSTNSLLFLLWPPWKGLGLTSLPFGVADDPTHPREFIGKWLLGDSFASSQESMWTFDDHILQECDWKLGKLASSFHSYVKQDAASASSDEWIGQVVPVIWYLNFYQTKNADPVYCTPE